MNSSDPSLTALAAPKESNSGIALAIGRHKKEVGSFVIVCVLFSRISV